MRDRTSFLRPDLAQLAAYTPHPGGETPAIVDRLDTNESPLDLPTDIKSKLAWAYQEQIEANRYPDGSHQELKKAIAEYTTESANLNDSLNTDNISVGNGSDELIRSILIATCLGGNGSILVATPTFSMYAILAKTLGIPVVTIARDETDFSLDIAAAQQAIESTDNPPIKVVFVVHPNSPTGNVLADKELDWLKSLPENILVVVDEAYFEFSQTSIVGEIKQRNNWIILRTFSKAFRLAAHRVGYAIANPDIIRVLEKVRLPYNLPSFSQIAVSVVLQQRQLLLPLVQETIEERKRVYSVLQQNSHFQVWQSQANFLYLRLNNIDRNHQDSLLAKVTASLKAEGTLIRHTGGGLRITVGTPQESDRTLARLEKQVSLLINN
ncbi:histidinol-phosphate transaminase [Waterburya agarophytonicola K14]|uniref:Histidinol-phosphate aminotransferase n=1 Tax=Waterburya agarophytonicola KI4 TaxID=2874699 RepID=A0A964FG82_9CYAN|nr:histidinol-phosphate transaminase [Waterburya agarophytonicola]MCC0176324.1 histidinol-phosphate transaminase [Waterburya agarophytonicola KI4]